MRRTRKLTTVTALTTVFAMALASAALADIVTNNVTSTASGKILTIQAGSSATVTYGVQNTNEQHGDTQNSCNPADGTALTITPTGLPPYVSAPAAQATQCSSTAASILFSVGTATTPGDYLIGHTFADSGGGRYENQANFTLRVTAAPVTNTAPTVPGQPSGISPNNGGFTLSWTASTDAENNTIAYTLERRNSASGAAFTAVTPAPGSNSYDFTSHPEGTWTYRVKASDGSLSSAYSTESDPIKVDRSAPNAPTAAATTSATYNDGTLNWWKGSVTVAFSPNGDPDLADGSPGSGVKLSTLTANQTFSATGTHTASGTVNDNVGHASSPGTLTVGVDATNPTAQMTTCPSPVLFGSSASADWTASDVGSGLATAASGSIPLDTNSVGTKTATGPVPQDNVGNNGTAPACSYSVQYESTGILQPINPDGSSKFKLNSTIPVKMKLTGASAGVNDAVITITLSKVTSSVTGEELEPVSTATPHSGNTLRYDAVSDQYIFNLATKNLSTGTWRVTLDLGGGKTETATFSIVK